MVWALWFRETDATDGSGGPAAEAEHHGQVAPARDRAREPLTLLVPTVLTAFFTLALGLGAGAPFSPLQMAEFIAEAVFR